MSRYSFPAQHQGLTVVVGWDNPLATFFAEVFDSSIEEDAEAYVLWIGTAPQALPTVAALQAQLAGWPRSRPRSSRTSPTISRRPHRPPPSSGGRSRSWRAPSPLACTRAYVQILLVSQTQHEGDSRDVLMHKAKRKRLRRNPRKVPPQALTNPPSREKFQCRV